MGGRQRSSFRAVEHRSAYDQEGACSKPERWRNPRQVGAWAIFRPCAEVSFPCMMTRQVSQRPVSTSPSARSGVIVPTDV